MKNIENQILDISEIKSFALKFCKILNLGDVIMLKGELGVGKTTLSRFIIDHLYTLNNLSTPYSIKSPTYPILLTYDLNTFEIYHYDLFRLKSTAEIKNLDLFEENLNVITLIEWPQIIEKKPQNLIELIFNYEGDHNKRSVQIKGLKI